LIITTLSAQSSRRVSITASVTTHFATHTAAVTIAISMHFATHTAAVTTTISMHFASVTITVIAFTSDVEAKQPFGVCDGGGGNCNSCEGSKNNSKLLHSGFLIERDVR
jgi:hypothetical protein